MLIAVALILLIAVAAQNAAATDAPSTSPTPYVVATVPLGSNPKGVAADAGNGRVYVGLYNGAPTSNLAVVDSATGAVLPALGTQGTRPNGVAVNPLTHIVYVTNRDSNDLSVIDPATSDRPRVTVGSLPWGVAVHPTLNYVYVANFSSSSVSVINGATRNVVYTNGGVPQASYVAVDAVNNLVYVTSNGQGLYLLNAMTGGMVFGPIPTSADSRGVAVHPTTGRAYIVNRDPANPRLFVRQPNGDLTHSTLPAPPVNVAVNPTTDHLFITLLNGSNLSLLVLDLPSLQTIATINLGAEDADEGGQGLAVDSVLNRVFVTRYQAGELVIIADPLPTTPTATATRTATSVPPSPTATRTATPTTPPLPTFTRTATPTNLPPTATPTWTHTATATATPSPTNTATVTATFVATPIGGWPHRAALPIIVSEPPPATPTRTATPTVTPTMGSLDWRIPDFLHVSLSPADVSSGQMYWRLVQAIYQDDTQSGGKHHVYYRVEDESGQGIVGVFVCLGWADGQDCSRYTEPNAYFGANVAMWESYNPALGAGPYFAWVNGLPSDRVMGLGLPLNHHVNFLLTFRRTVAP
jgi:YVTN family beta-propeller protein